LARVGKSTHTIRAYSHDLTSFARWWEQTTGQAFNPQAVDSPDIQEYRGYLQRQHSTATVNRRLKGLRSFFRWAEREQLVSDSPFDILEKIFIKDEQQQELAPLWLHPKEQRRLLRAAREAGNVRDLAILQTFLGTGLRISELAALEVADLEISERKGALRIRAGKGIKARKLPLDNRTRQALWTYLEQRAEEGSDHLFLGQRGPLKVRAINYVVAKYAYQARLEKPCTAHTLRHSFAKNLVDAGTPLDLVARLLGHKSLETTKIYTQPSEQDLERAVRRAAGEMEEL